MPSGNLRHGAGDARQGSGVPRGLFFFFFFLLPFDSLRDEIVTERKERKKGRKRGGEKERENERERESRSTRALVKGKTSRGRLPLAIRSVSVSIDPREE